jgi:antitoxin ParD1/3/4
MNVSLTEEFERYINQKVESGLYHSASEVVRDGLRLMKERDELHQSRLAELRKEIAIGIEQADRGQVRPFDEATMARVKARGRKRHAPPGTRQTRHERTEAD